jgi:hypothetical protein
MMNSTNLRVFLIAAACLSAFAVLAPSAHAQKAYMGAEDDVLLEFDLFFQTYALFANETDFDRSRPVYSKNGQTEGYVLTTFRPGMTWRPWDFVAIRYQLEVGDNFWSRNDPDSQNMQSPGTAVVRHKEMWGEVTTQDKAFGIKTGYMYFYDPTHLVLDRHMGAGQGFYQWQSGKLTLAAGQIPDEVFEGIAAQSDSDRVRQNNFEQDKYIFGAWANIGRTNNWRVSPGAFLQWDKTEIDRPKTVLSPLVNAQFLFGGKVGLEVDLVGQYGKYLRGGVDNRDVSYLAGAAQAGLHADAWPVKLDTNLLAFTSDDGDKYDEYDTGFHYSGWSKSKLMILTRNWLHDQYDNIDERAAAQGAGLFTGDQTVSVYLHETFRLMAIGGVGMTLDSTNTDGSSYLGAEGHFGAEFAPYQGHVSFMLLGGGLLPGKAAAMLKNRIDKKETDPLGQIQGSMTLTF